MRLRKVGNNRLVAVRGVRKEIKDALLFHQPRREVEVAFTVLHTIFAGREGTLDLVADI